MNEKYDIFISYKRKSLPTANNLYYRLTTRGYSTFFDLEEMRRDNFNVQLLSYIENAIDVFVILEEGSLDACKNPDWEEDWFCKEIAYALEKKKNIIPILLNGYHMPPRAFFPNKLKELTFKHAPEFNFSFFEAYLDKLIEKEYLLSKPNLQEKVTSVFKFYSNENCQVFKEGKLVCSLEGLSDEPYYLPVPRKGDYRFKGINSITKETKVIKEHIEAEEEKEIEIEWEVPKSSNSDKERTETLLVNRETFSVDLGELKFNMIRVEGGEIEVGATAEQVNDADENEWPAHRIACHTFYIGQFPITQNIWEIVMGYNKSLFKKNEMKLSAELEELKKALGINTLSASAILGLPAGLLVGVGLTWGAKKAKQWIEKYMTDNALYGSDKGHYPIENITYDEALEFVKRLSQMTNLEFSLPTENEWEYAARGGQRSKGFKYAGSNTLDEVAWYRDNSDGATHPVGEKKPNELGLYDMSGNVWEWTETPAHPYGIDMEEGGDVYIRRGGSWWHKSQNCRVSKRYPSIRSKKTSGLGLRVVLRECRTNDK